MTEYVIEIYSIKIQVVAREFLIKISLYKYSQEKYGTDGLSFFFFSRHRGAIFPSTWDY